MNEGALAQEQQPLALKASQCCLPDVKDLSKANLCSGNRSGSPPRLRMVEEVERRASGWNSMPRHVVSTRHSQPAQLHSTGSTMFHMLKRRVNHMTSEMQTLLTYHACPSSKTSRCPSSAQTSDQRLLHLPRAMDPTDHKKHTSNSAQLSLVLPVSPPFFGN